MTDILFKTDDFVFSYRVAGVCVQDGRVLLQRVGNEYAFPGGHVSFGETNEETLVREFFEETGCSVSVGELKWVGEHFFPWGERSCHQICLYYAVSSADNKRLPFSIKGKEGKGVEFEWVDLTDLPEILYPPQAKEFLSDPTAGVRHFIDKED